MTIADIKKAVNKGKQVYWISTTYQVIPDFNQQYLITYLPDGNCIGLTT
jgi:hypothetical protein